MKKFSLLLLFLLPLVGALRAQNSVVLKGGYDTTLSGKTVWIHTWGASGCNNSYTTTTNSAGQFTYNLNLGSCSYASMAISIIGCRSAYDTLTKNVVYDTSKNGDTLVFNFKYCDTNCQYFHSSIYASRQLYYKVVGFFAQPYNGNKYTWSFGDGGTAVTTSYVANHTYANFGNYTVKVKAQDTIKGCIDSAVYNLYLPIADSVYVHGQLDSAISGKTVIISQYVSGWGYYNKAFTTNSSGQYGGWFPVVDSVGGLTASVKNCHNDSSYNTGAYAHYGDSVNIDLVFCPIMSCGSFNASFTYSKSLRVLGLTNTSSSNANNFYWDFGDGQYSTVKHPVHTYAADGYYIVTLLARDTVNGCLDTSKSWIYITTAGSLYGIITLDSTMDTIADHTCRIWLIKKDSVGTDILLTAVDSTLIDSSIYTFQGVPQGTYLVKAALLPTAAHYADYLPTYYGISTLWSGALDATVTAGSSNWASIELIKGTNPGGPGFISGYVSAGANKVGDPLEKIEVLLLTITDQPVACTYTDGDGKYEFSNLAFGTYKVLVEVPGKPSEAWVVTLDQNNTQAKDLKFEVNSKDIKKSATTTGIANVDNGALNIYPNPATTEINIAIDATLNGDANVHITDISGKTMKTISQPVETGKNTINISAADLANGVYIINVNTAEGSYTRRISINR